MQLLFPLLVNLVIKTSLFDAQALLFGGCLRLGVALRRVL